MNINEEVFTSWLQEDGITKKSHQQEIWRNRPQRIENMEASITAREYFRVHNLAYVAKLADEDRLHEITETVGGVN